MKTILPVAITTPEEAKAFLTALSDNGEVFHPEDDAHDIVWNVCPAPTTEEADLLNKLMNDIYNLPGNDGRHIAPMIFDPCEHLLDLDNTGEFEVFSSNGLFNVNVQNGNVVHYEPEAGGDSRTNETINIFDIKEWEKYYPDEKITRHSRIDILDLGCWLKDGTYEEPCNDWRKKLAYCRDQSVIR